MKLRGIDFGYVFNASGARGFFGGGHDYWFHRPLRPFGLDYTGSTFVAKTTTLEPRAGNMPLREDGITPVELFPKCIVVKPFKGVVLNSVGLSGPGADALFADGRWQAQNKPFMISFMSVKQTLSERLDELNEFLHMLERAKPGFQSPFGLQLNFSCPNVGLDTTHLVREVRHSLDLLGDLDLPVAIKLNVLVPVKAAVDLAYHDRCDAVIMSNTIPWRQQPSVADKKGKQIIIPWEKLFGSATSPLDHLGGGGLSGNPLLPIVTAWIREARTRSCVWMTKPIIGGGGILSRRDAYKMFAAGAHAIELGSISILRPWRVRSIIQYANNFANHFHHHFGVSCQE